MRIIIHDSAMSKEVTAVTRGRIVDLRQGMAIPRLYE